MRGKFLTLAGATGLGLLALTGMQGTAQAHEGYHHSYFHGDRGRDHGRGYFFHFRHYRDHDGYRR